MTVRDDEIWHRDADGYPHYHCRVRGCRTMIISPKSVCAYHGDRWAKSWEYPLSGPVWGTWLGRWLWTHWIEREGRRNVHERWMKEVRK